MKYQRYKTTGESYGFNELSRMLKRRVCKLDIKTYYYLIGRLSEAKCDILISPSGKRYTVAGSKDIGFLWEVE